MVDYFTNDLGIKSFPIVTGETGYFFYERSPLAELLNGELNKLASENACLNLVSAQGLNHKGYQTHFDSDSYHELGRRYAQKMIELHTTCSAAIQ